mmetsp:Transcript_28586/g.42254  ORF Transcript_28586/g.42254 Transcript_28586/m.42254 type:complete len:141 (-) Transcript_28586:103-525(-)|eukprot:CAMPEP_0194205858 /NCGR_PEP_ID=MMETSP0156-20130528/5043_1 /TAXON_ID=33649 /ORGANISM="Thalassionema nitzschioides, Strain L26-B" /LENGTH=140 /DNA_ID=CAMNT_0038932241 /DNA_START=538 /DNA_END=960 /DNA_ORIENTATION=-
MNAFFQALGPVFWAGFTSVPPPNNTFGTRPVDTSTESGPDNKFKMTQYCNRPVCSLPVNRGNCHFYFYNNDSGNCEVFVFGGCQGNEKQFETKSDCEATCGACQTNTNNDNDTTTANNNDPSSSANRPSMLRQFGWLMPQ